MATADRDGDRPHVRFSMLHLDVNENGLPENEPEKRATASRKYLLIGILCVLASVIMAIIALAVGLAVTGEVKRAINGSSKSNASIPTITPAFPSSASTSTLDTLSTTRNAVSTSVLSSTMEPTPVTTPADSSSISSDIPDPITTPDSIVPVVTTVSSSQTTTANQSTLTSPLPACLPDEFRCTSGQCVIGSAVCNRRIDCLDQSDEKFCPDCRQAGGFQCDSGFCLWDRRSRCNSIADCADLTDEINCTRKSHLYLCKNGIQIHQSLVCNGVDDCDDNSDESGCNCDNGRLRCSDGQCYMREWRCDGYPDCVNGTDEEGCDRCSEIEFVCRNYKCLNQSQVCDGVFDCHQREDELHCVHLANASALSQLTIQSTRGYLQVCADYWTDSHSNFICHQLDRSFRSVSYTDIQNTTSTTVFLMLRSAAEFTSSQPITSFFKHRSSCPTSKTVALFCTLQECGQRKANFMTPFVAGGNIVPEGKWPWVVSLSYQGKPLCVGALFNRQWVITAGHCVVRSGQFNYTKTPWYIEVLAGTVDRLSNVSKIRAASIHYHPNLTETTAGVVDWDVALVKLVTPVSLTDHIQPICLPYTGQKFSFNSQCILAGWGLVNNVQYLTPRKLRDAKMVIWDSVQCSRNTVGSETSVNTNSTLCAGYRMGLPTGCQSNWQSSDPTSSQEEINRPHPLLLLYLHPGL